MPEAALVPLREHLIGLVHLAQEQSNDEGVWTRFVVTLGDLAERDEKE